MNRPSLGTRDRQQGDGLLELLLESLDGSADNMLLDRGGERQAGWKFGLEKGFAWSHGGESELAQGARGWEGLVREFGSPQRDRLDR